MLLLLLLVGTPYKGQNRVNAGHHRPHLHAPCAIDLNAKTQRFRGLENVRREVAANRNGNAEIAAVRAATLTAVSLSIHRWILF